MNMHEFDPSARFAPVEAVVVNAVGDELVMLDLDSSTYFGLDEVGRWIWTQIGEARTLAEICEGLVALYDVRLVEAEHDVSGLMRQLLDAGLVRATP